MRLPTRLTAAVVLAASCGLAGCAAQPTSAVVVRVAPSGDPTPLEVQVADARGGFRADGEIRPGQARRFDVPAGWVTVRIPGRCVVPAAVHGTAVVHVGRAHCSLG